MTTAIETERLRLRTMSPEFLRASLANDRVRAEALMGSILPDDWPDLPDVLELRLRQLDATPEWEPWLTRVIERRSDRRVIGITGFHGPPGGAWLREWAPGGVEFGYTVRPEWRRQGFATEACGALMAWARRTAAVRCFILSMHAGNDASRALARRLGFSRVGMWHHEVRGPEDVYRACLE